MANEIIIEQSGNIGDEMIKIKQLPIIEQKLRTIKERFERETESALKLECTEETRQLVKARRAELTKIFNDLETRRKAVKSAILAPYEDFEKIYKDCVTNIYKPCDDELAAKIAQVEDGLKEEKRQAANEYFAESCQAAGIDFLTLENVGLSIGISTSKKQIREKISAFVTKVAEELTLIEAQENSAEVLIEYKQSLNAAAAILAVKNRHKTMVEEQARLDERRARTEQQEIVVNRVENAEAELKAPVAEEITAVSEPVQAADPVYELSFVVRGTLAQLKALKTFLSNNGYDVRNGDDENG